MARQREGSQEGVLEPGENALNIGVVGIGVEVELPDKALAALIHGLVDQRTDGGVGDALHDGLIPLQGADYAKEYVGFADCAVDRIVPKASFENPLDVAVEQYTEWDVEKGGWKGERPEIEGLGRGRRCSPRWSYTPSGCPGRRRWRGRCSG